MVVLFWFYGGFIVVLLWLIVVWSWFITVNSGLIVVYCGLYCGSFSWFYGENGGDVSWFSWWFSWCLTWGKHFWNTGNSIQQILIIEWEDLGNILMHMCARRRYTVDILVAFWWWWWWWWWWWYFLVQCAPSLQLFFVDFPWRWLLEMTKKIYHWKNWAPMISRCKAKGVFPAIGHSSRGKFCWVPELDSGVF